MDTQFVGSSWPSRQTAKPPTKEDGPQPQRGGWLERGGGQRARVGREHGARTCVQGATVAPASTRCVGRRGGQRMTDFRELSRLPKDRGYWTALERRIVYELRPLLRDAAEAGSAWWGPLASRAWRLGALAAAVGLAALIILPPRAVERPGGGAPCTARARPAPSAPAGGRRRARRPRWRSASERDARWSPPRRRRSPPARPSRVRLPRALPLLIHELRERT
jgi:hypothetical protein